MFTERNILFYRPMLWRHSTSLELWSCISKASLAFMTRTWNNVNAVKLIAPSIIIRLIYPALVSSACYGDGSVFSTYPLQILSFESTMLENEWTVCERETTRIFLNRTGIYFAREHQPFNISFLIYSWRTISVAMFLHLL